MAQTQDRKDYPISMRLPEADVAMIDRAAALKGRRGRSSSVTRPCGPPRKR